MLKDEIEKNQLEKVAQKKQESIRVNLLNSLPESWDWDRFIEIKKKNYKISLLTNLMLKFEIEKKTELMRLINDA
jgi:hypothetical protein